MIGKVVVWFLIGYFSGSIPWGYIIVKLVRGIDIRNYGSGNIGATNVYRVLGIWWALTTFLLDALKGFLPVIYSMKTIPSPWIYLVALSPFVGHCYTIWLKGKGGKGVATSAGILLALTPQAFLIVFAIWLLVVAIFRISSLGALVAALALPFVTYFLYRKLDLTLFTILLAVWVILRHRENIRRFLKGEEKTERIR